MFCPVGGRAPETPSPNWTHSRSLASVSSEYARSSGAAPYSVGLGVQATSPTRSVISGAAPVSVGAARQVSGRRHYVVGSPRLMYLNFQLLGATPRKASERTRTALVWRVTAQSGDSGGWTLMFDAMTGAVLSQASVDSEALDYMMQSGRGGNRSSRGNEDHRVDPQLGEPVERVVDDEEVDEKQDPDDDHDRRDRGSPHGRPTPSSRSTG